MKLSIEQANELLKELGVGAVVVTDGHDVDLSIDDLSSSIAQKAVEAHKPVLEQEIGAAKTTEIQKMLGDMERKNVAKVFGITDKKSLEGKSLEDMLKMAKEATESKTGYKEDEWNQKYGELAQEVENWETKYNTDTQTLNAQWQEKYESRDVHANLLSIFEGIPRKGGDLQEQMLSYAAAVERNGLKLKPSQEGKLAFYKDNQLYVDGGKAPDVTKHAKEWAKKAGILAEDTSHIAPSGVTSAQAQTRVQMPRSEKGAHPMTAIAKAFGAEV